VGGLAKNLRPPAKLPRFLSGNF